MTNTVRASDYRKKYQTVVGGDTERTVRGRDVLDEATVAEDQQHLTVVDDGGVEAGR